MMRSIAVILLLTMPFAALMAAGTEEELGPGLYAELTTNRGVMVFLLDPSNTPLAVANFCGLAEGLLPNDEKGPGIPYYDGLTFYREAPEYAVFSGDPQGTGTGGPGYTIPREPGAVISTESPGTLVMDGLFTESAGSRFFITIQGDPFLDSKYTAFGRIISGERVLKKLHRDDVLESVRVIRVGEKAQSFSFDKASFDELYASARDNEIEALGEANPALPEVIKALGDDMVKTYTGIYYQVLSEGEGEKTEIRISGFHELRRTAAEWYGFRQLHTARSDLRFCPGTRRRDTRMDRNGQRHDHRRVQKGRGSAASRLWRPGPRTD
jgi:peptidyl-prolyl cis-trans isomerase A (cyclophilin A)